jgi:hypothetical protein
MEQFMMTPEQIQDFCKLFVKGMITACVPFAFVGNEFIRSAFAMIGVRLSAKDVAGPLLVEICAEQQGFDRTLLATMDFPCGSSDGWRKNCCLGGAGLMNLTVLGNKGTMLKHCCKLVHEY